MSATAFDRLAPQYERLWTGTPAGQLQREAVWRHIAPLFKRGQTILDLGCGPGDDALRLIESGVRVRAIDSSPEMVKLARARGVDAQLLAIENCDALNESFDAVLSNFGALNCVEDLPSVAGSLARLVRPGGHLAICVIGRSCLWETAWALRRAQFAKGFRRWRASSMSSLSFQVFYPSKNALKAAFEPHFILRNWRGIGFAVPPSYVAGISSAALRRLDFLDRRTAHWPVVRGLSDHRLFVFVRKQTCP